MSKITKHCTSSHERSILDASMRIPFGLVVRRQSTCRCGKTWLHYRYVVTFLRCLILGCAVESCHVDISAEKLFFIVLYSQDLILTSDFKRQQRRKILIEWYCAYIIRKSFWTVFCGCKFCSFSDGLGDAARYFGQIGLRAVFIL